MITASVVGGAALTAFVAWIMHARVGIVVSVAVLAGACVVGLIEVSGRRAENDSRDDSADSQVGVGALDQRPAEPTVPLPTCARPQRSPRSVEPAEVLLTYFENSKLAGPSVSAHLWLDDPSSETLRLVCAQGSMRPSGVPAARGNGVLGKALSDRAAHLARVQGPEAVGGVVVWRYAVPLSTGDANGVAAIDFVGEEGPNLEALTSITADVRASLTSALALVVARSQTESARILLDAGRELSRLLDPAAVISATLDRAMQMSGANTGSVMLLDPDGGLRIAQSRGLPSDVVRSTRVGEGEGIAGWVLASGQSMLVEDLKRPSARRPRHGVRSAVSVPIADDDGVMGVLNVGSRAFHARFSASHLQALESLGRSAALALRNSRALRETQELYFDTLKALAVALETKDPFAFGATERVIEHAMRIGRAMHLTHPEMQALRIAAMLHDVGMSAAGELVTVSDRPLSTVEWGMLKMHPVIARDVLEQAPALRDAVPIVYHHHEHYDGTGYVAGLAGEKIPLGSRILAVADAYVAMTSDRPYRQAISHAEALRELSAHSGRQFDPDVVAAFAQIKPVAVPTAEPMRATAVEPRE